MCGIRLQCSGERVADKMFKTPIRAYHMARRQYPESTCMQGHWRGISRHYVTTRTPTQVASHAQKYSLRTMGVTKRRSRFSALEEQQAQAQVQLCGTCSRCVGVFCFAALYDALQLLPQ